MPRSNTAFADTDSIDAPSDIEAVTDQPLLPERLGAFAQELAMGAVADSLTAAIRADGRSLRAIAAAADLDPAHLSRLAAGRNCETATLARVALALGKSLHISIH